MKQKIIKYFTLIFLSILVGGIGAYFYKTYKIESNNIASYQFNQRMFEDTKLVEKYFSNIQSVIYEEKFSFAFKSFINKKDLEYVEKKVSKNIYDLEELGFEKSLYCNIKIVFGDKNQIICEKGGKYLIILEEFKPTLWSCKFNNSIDLKPTKCLDEQEVLAEKKQDLSIVKN